MSRELQVELTTMCMIRNQKGQILIQDRQKTDWPGWTFPGGHVEKNEDILSAMKREIKEETGLEVLPFLVGISEWLNDSSGKRELAALFVAKTMEDYLKDTEEPLLWVSEEELSQEGLAGTLNQLLPIFFQEKQFYFKDNSEQ